MSKQNNYIQQIQHCYPDIEIQSVQLNAMGQHNDVLIINDHLIFRFPKFEDGIRQLAIETAILQGIQGQVSLKTPSPIYQNIETSLVGAAFIGYEMIKGEPLWRETVSSITEEAVLQKLATQIATFLKALHGISVEETFSQPLPLVDKREEWLDLYERIQEKLFAFMRTDAQLVVSEHFETYLDTSENFAFEPVLRHGDFGTVNLLYDGNTQSIAGVIDFGNAGLGDPAVDFAGIISPVGYGESFLKRFEGIYPNIEATTRRTKFYVGTFALQEALYGVEHNDREAFEAGIENYR
jgi:aminoglycoside 2''-phosphotransferase